MAFGLNFGKDKATASQDVFAGQSFEDFYNNMNAMFGNTMGNSRTMMSGAQGLNPFFQNLMGMGTTSVGSLLDGGAAGGNQDQIMRQLMDSLRTTAGPSNTGKMYESIVGGEGNTYIDPMVDAMKRSSMENLDMLTNRVGLDAVAAGQSGSSRHAMTDAMLARTANNDMLDREMNMRGGAYDTDLRMKLDIAKMADQGVAGTQDRLMSLLGSTDSNRMAGIQGLSGLGQLGMSSMNPMMMAMMAPYYAMQMQGNAMGDPTVTSTQSSKGKSFGFGL